MLAGLGQMATGFTRMVAILLSAPMTVCGGDWWTTGENEDSIMKTRRTQIIFATLGVALTLSCASAWAVTHAENEDK